MPQSYNPVTGYDFRYNAEGLTAEDLIASLEGIAKKFVFQREVSDNGYDHYQGRLSLIKKRRKNEALRLFVTPPHYFEPTLTSQFLTGEAFYMMKLDTRVEGPWTDKDEKKYATKQLSIFLGYTMRPYQQSIIDECSIFDLRKINLIWDEQGCCGKSLLSEYLEYMGLAEEIPPFRLMDDIFQWVYGRPKKKAYIVDMPRGMKKDRLGDFYSGIEVVKNGVAYDKRYHAKKVRFDRPRVFIFTNELPRFNLMSKDRWVVWRIKSDWTYELFNPCS